MVEDSEEERPGIANSLGLELTCCGMDRTFPKFVKASVPGVSVCR